jgi:hypothetical protein
MQKGKARAGRKVLPLRNAAAACLIASIAAACVGPARADSWGRGMGGVSFPYRFHPADAGGGAAGLLIVFSAANPYSMPDLFQSSFAVSVVRNRWSTAAAWDRTGSRNYSQDVLVVSAGFAPAWSFLHILAAAAADRRSVAGLGSEGYATVRLGVSLECRPSLSLQIEREAYASGEGLLSPVGARYRACAAADLGTLLLCASVRAGSGGGAIVSAGAALRAAGPLSVMTGLRLDTGEVSCGAAIESAVRASLSWSSHPVLGHTISFSIGVAR